MSLRGPAARLWLAGAALSLLAGSAGAQVVLAGVLGGKALLVIDGAAPRTLVAGQSIEGVKLVSVGADHAVVEIDGSRQTLRVGETPLSVGARGVAGAGRGGRIVLSAGTGGHFTALGQINGRAANFMVDTGATLVGISLADAQRLGINYRSGEQGQVSTANGVVPAWKVKLDSVRLGDVVVHGVDAVVTQGSMPHILLGNSFLGRFQMTRDNDQMVLERRY